MHGVSPPPQAALNDATEMLMGPVNVVFAGEWTPLDPKWNCLTTILLPYVLGASWADDRHHDPVALPHHHP